MMPLLQALHEIADRWRSNRRGVYSEEIADQFCAVLDRYKAEVGRPRQIAIIHDTGWTARDKRNICLVAQMESESHDAFIARVEAKIAELKSLPCSRVPDRTRHFMVHATYHYDNAYEG